MIEAHHNADIAKKLNNDNFWGLETCLYLCVNAYVTVQINLCTPAGLMLNGSEGIVNDIVYADGGGPTSQPKFIMVDFGAQKRSILLSRQSKPQSMGTNLPIHSNVSTSKARQKR